MKYTTLPMEGLTLDGLLAEGNRKKAVFLTSNRKVRFVLMPADDGDLEVCALENSPEFLAYLKGAVKRAKKGKRTPLREVRAMFAETA